MYLHMCHFCAHILLCVISAYSFYEVAQSVILLLGMILIVQSKIVVS